MEATAKPTRQDYMNRKVTHEEYYRAVVATAGVSFKNVGDKFLQRVKLALIEGDEHLNTIPLGEWDQRALSLIPSARAAFKKHGDGYSLAGGVCLVKQAAKDAATA